MAILNGTRYIRHGDFRLVLPIYDPAGPVPKLNAAGAPGSITATLSKDNGAFGALTAGGGASVISQELAEVDLTDAGDDTDCTMFHVKLVLTTHGLTPVVYGPFFTEPCLHSGILPNAHNGDQTTLLVYLNDAASAVANAYQWQMLEVVDAQSGVSEDSLGQKRLIVGYDGTDKFCTLLTPLPTALDDVCQVKITALSRGEAMMQLLHEAGVVPGVASGTPTTTSVPSNLTGYGTNAFLNSVLVDVKRHVLRQVTAYDTATGTFTVDALPAAPSADDPIAVTGSFG